MSDDPTLDEAAHASAAALPFPSARARARFADELLAPVARHVLAAQARGAQVVGVYGAQGSGKTTLTTALSTLLRGHSGLRVASLSLDDFYLTRPHRMRVAQRMHPLFATRGVPGTHDVALLQRTLDALLGRTVSPGASVWIPRFDKARDDRAEQGDEVTAPVDLVLLEGWCLAVPPEPPERLASPLNALEAEADPDGRFRRCVNYRLAHDYAQLATRVDWLLALMVESFEVSCEQRLEQEHALRARVGSGPGPSGMSDAEVEAFMQRFERVTRWALECMGERADLSVRLDREHAPRVPVPRP